MSGALGKVFFKKNKLCRVPNLGHSAKKNFFAECQVRSHSAKRWLKKLKNPLSSAGSEHSAKEGGNLTPPANFACSLDPLCSALLSVSVLLRVVAGGRRCDVVDCGPRGLHRRGRAQRRARRLLPPLRRPRPLVRPRGHLRRLAELNGLLRCASPVEAARGEPALLGSSTGSIRSVVRDACLFGLVGVQLWSTLLCFLRGCDAFVGMPR